MSRSLKELNYEGDVQSLVDFIDGDLSIKCKEIMSLNGFNSENFSVDSRVEWLKQSFSNIKGLLYGSYFNYYGVDSEIELSAICGLLVEWSNTVVLFNATNSEDEKHIDSCLNESEFDMLTKQMTVFQQTMLDHFHPSIVKQACGDYIYSLMSGDDETNSVDYSEYVKAQEKLDIDQLIDSKYDFDGDSDA